MKRLFATLYNLRISKDEKGQDLIEYALMAGLIAVAAAVFIPTLTTSIHGIFTKIGSVLTAAAV